MFKNFVTMLVVGGALIPAPTAHSLSASTWTYDGEFQTTNSKTTSNAPMFMDINSNNELAYGLLPSNATAGTGVVDVYVVSGILNPADSTSTIPVTQVLVPNNITVDATRGITGVAFKSDGTLFISGDGGATNRQVQAFTRTGPMTYVSNAPVSLAANLGRIHGLAFSPVNPNLLVVGELVTARKVHVFNVTGPTSLAEIGTGITVPSIGAGAHVRDVAVDTNENLLINANGSILKMVGPGLSSVSSLAGYTTATTLFSPGTDNNVNGTGITWTDLTDEKAVIGVRGNSPSAQPRYIGVYNSETTSPIAQVSDSFASERVKPVGSPLGNDFASQSTCGDAKVIMGPSSTPYLFITDIGRGRILRFRAVQPVTSVRDWSLFN